MLLAEELLMESCIVRRKKSIFEFFFYDCFETVRTVIDRKDWNPVDTSSDHTSEPRVSATDLIWLCRQIGSREKQKVT